MAAGTYQQVEMILLAQPPPVEESVKGGRLRIFRTVLAGMLHVGWHLQFQVQVQAGWCVAYERWSYA
jgi:hypothetical protein